MLDKRRIPARLRRISDKGLATIARFEGWEPKLYNDAAGHATIGYGHLLHLGPYTLSDRRRYPKGISHKEGLALLRKDARTKAADHVRKLKIPLTQYEFDALVSLVYNLGPGVLQRGHSLGNAIPTRSRMKIAQAMSLYDMAGGRHLEGLTRRREAERLLFLRGIYPS